VRTELQQLGIDHFVYGNGFISLHVGIVRTLVCPGCGKPLEITASSTYDTMWEYRAGHFHFKKCPACGASGMADVIDVPSTNMRECNLVRWNPQNIDVKYYPITGRSRYFYQIPPETKRNIMLGKDQYLIKTMPKSFLDAVNKTDESTGWIELDADNVFHFKRPTLAEADMGWGKPLIIHSLQRLFYTYTLRRAQESIAVSQNINPFNIIFPQGAQGINVFEDLDLGAWNAKSRTELEHHRKDPNYVGIMPLPMGTAKIGGEGRMLLIGPEMEEGNKAVCGGMGIPIEFVFGGLSWSGSSITLRILENFFVGYRSDIIRVLNFIVRQLRRVNDWPECEMDMTELRMADDIQRQQLAIQLNAANKISDSSLMNEFGWDSLKEAELIKKEDKFRSEIAQMQSSSQAVASGESSVISARYQAIAAIENQVTTNQNSDKLQNSLPYIQKMTQRLNDVLNYGQMMMTYLQMFGLTPPPPPPPVEGAPAEGGAAPAGGAPGPEQGAPAPTDAPPQQGEIAPMSPEQQEAGASPGEPPSVQQAQYDNPFYKNTGRPDYEAMIKRFATDIAQMDPGSRQMVLAQVQQQNPAFYQKLVQYVNLTPMGGTASDATNALQPLPENRPPRRGGGAGLTGG
jgi:hypothetical protein